MAIVDEQGRVFGRFNVLDVVIAVLLLGLLPLAYASYALFKQPPPTLASVEPAALVFGPDQRVTIHGQNLRPYLRVSFGDFQGLNFLFKSSTEAEVELRDVPPGTYDVVLYDFSQERARLLKAVTIAASPLPATAVAAAGMLGNLTAEQAARVVAGMEIPGVGTVVEVGKIRPDRTRVFSGYVPVEIPIDKAMRLPVLLRIGCDVRPGQGPPQCVATGVALQATVMLLLPTSFGTFPFQVDQVRSPLPVERVRALVRFRNIPALVDQIKVGDIDVATAMNELVAGAVVIQASPSHPLGDAAERDVTMTVQVQKLEHGWMYGTTPLRAGSVLTLRTTNYELQGLVLQLTPETSPAATGR